MSGAITAPTRDTNKINKKSFLLKEDGLCRVAGVIVAAHIRYTKHESRSGFTDSNVGLARVDTEPKKAAARIAETYPKLLDL